MILLGSFPVLSMSCGVSVFGSRGLAVGQYVYMEVEDSSLPLLRRVMRKSPTPAEVSEEEHKACKSDVCQYL